MRVTWAVICRYAETAADGTATLVGASLQAVDVEALPRSIELDLMLEITGALYEFEEEHTLDVTLIDPELDQHPLLNATLQASSEPPPTPHPGLDPTFFVPGQIGWRAEHPGLYTVDVALDGKRERSIPLVVREAA